MHMRTTLNIDDTLLRKAATLALARRERLVSDCLSGLAGCDHSRLTPAEEHEVLRSERARNLSLCSNGWDGCDRARLNAREIAEVEELVPLGALDPDAIHVPSVYVQRVVLGKDHRKPIERRTTRPR